MLSVSTALVEAILDGLLTARSVGSSDRRDVVAALFCASRRGVHSHGIRLIWPYLRGLDEGRCRVNADMKITRQKSAAARLDADGAIGAVAAFRGAREAVALASESGLGMVSVVNSNHFGAASVYSLEIAKAGMVGVALSNSDALVVPAGGRVPLIGTNPISVAAPAVAGQIFCADLATSQGTYLKSLDTLAAGEALPRRVVADVLGTDAAETGLPMAALFPLGGHKGQCLGMIVTVLSAVLGAGPLDWEIDNLVTGDHRRPTRTSHSFIAIDIAAFRPLAQFGADLVRWMNTVRESAPAPGYAAVVCPGDLESRSERAARAGVIEVYEDDHRRLMRARDELGLALEGRS